MTLYPIFMYNQRELVFIERLFPLTGHPSAWYNRNMGWRWRSRGPMSKRVEGCRCRGMSKDVERLGVDRDMVDMIKWKYGMATGHPDTNKRSLTTA